jgi:hypothetical protein
MERSSCSPSDAELGGPRITALTALSTRKDGRTSGGRPSGVGVIGISGEFVPEEDDWDVLSRGDDACRPQRVGAWVSG